MKGNKGEWSEVYVFLKLLADGKIHAADKDMNKIEELYYTIIRIIRKEEGVLEYVRNGNITISYNDRKLLEVPIENFDKITKLIFQTIKTRKERGTFEIKEAKEFLNSIHVKKLKAKSSKKSDIEIIVHDVRTGANPKLGFSIKSELGSKPTLLNAGDKTNFVYKISHDGRFDSLTYKGLKSKELVSKLIDNGNKLIFECIEGDNFYYNLQVIDTKMPEIAGEMLLNYYIGKTRKISDAVEILEIKNPLDYKSNRGHKYYLYKVRNMLTDIALGMTPSAVWKGNYDATGGYIIVKKTGDLICYHIYDRSEFQDYLINNTCFDTPDTNRYNFGTIYKTDGNYKIKLNMQIRFL